MVYLSEIVERAKKYRNIETDKQIADMMGLTPPDFSKRKKTGTLLPLIIEWGISNKVNLHWLLTGEGKMILGRDAEGDNPEISELLEAAGKVLKSGNKVACEALETGIRYLSQTIQDRESMKETQKRQKNMESRMAALETRLKKSEEIRKEDLPEQRDNILKLRTIG